MPARNAAPLPPLAGWRRTSAPAAAARSAVASRDPSSTTSTRATCWRAPFTTAAIVSAQLYAGIRIASGPGLGSAIAVRGSSPARAGARRTDSGLVRDHDAVGARPRKRDRADAAKADVAQPGAILAGGIIPAAAGLDQHVQAHQRGGSRAALGFVDDQLADQHGATARQRGVAFAQDAAVIGFAPVVHDHRQQDGVVPGWIG